MLDRLRKLNNVCQVCGAEFAARQFNQKYCSQRCYQKANRAAKAKKRRDAGIPERVYNLTCKECGKPFQGSNSVTKFCSDACADRYEARAKAERERKKLEKEEAQGRLDKKIRETIRLHCSYGD